MVVIFWVKSQFFFFKSTVKFIYFIDLFLDYFLFLYVVGFYSLVFGPIYSTNKLLRCKHTVNTDK